MREMPSASRNRGERDRPERLALLDRAAPRRRRARRRGRRRRASRPSGPRGRLASSRSSTVAGVKPVLQLRPRAPRPRLAFAEAGACAREVGLAVAALDVEQRQDVGAHGSAAAARRRHARVERRRLGPLREALASPLPSSRPSRGEKHQSPAHAPPRAPASSSAGREERARLRARRAVPARGRARRRSPRVVRCEPFEPLGIRGARGSGVEDGAAAQGRPVAEHDAVAARRDRPASARRSWANRPDADERAPASGGAVVHASRARSAIGSAPSSSTSSR